MVRERHVAGDKAGKWYFNSVKEKEDGIQDRKKIRRKIKGQMMRDVVLNAFRLTLKDDERHFHEVKKRKKSDGIASPKKTGQIPRR